jgi:hypothetical protein
MSLRNPRGLAAALLLAFLATPVVGEEIFVLEDPRGDDFGAGDIVYPNRPDFPPGSLDLEFLSAREARDGTWFRARMGRPIQSPVGQVTSVGREPLENFARNGFYTFNIDIYVDTDRIAGSGRTDTLPGRQISVHRDTAWNKAIILTPRPRVARAWYAMHLAEVREAELRAATGRVAREDLARIEAEVEAEIDEYFFFPDRVRVRGREIDFFVPAEFLSGQARAEWAYTVLVTGADIEQAQRAFNISRREFTLMVMTVGMGRATNRFGIINQGDPNQPPVIDVLAPTVEVQRAMLSDFDAVAPRFAAVPGVSPAGVVSVAGPIAVPSAAPTPAPSVPAVPPSTATTPTIAPTPAPAEAARRSVPERLRTLNALRDEGLISETEYQQLRRKILSEI